MHLDILEYLSCQSGLSYKSDYQIVLEFYSGSFHFNSSSHSEVCRSQSD